MTSSPDFLFHRLTNTVLDRFCRGILSKIHCKIKWLNLESSSVECILLSTNYPNLCGLGLYNLASEMARDLLT
ncbi:unnamed protein product, partial [Rotaria sp. Silwood2]